MSHYTKFRALSEVVFQQAGIVCFPLLQNLPIYAGFSWGKESLNMSLKTQENTDVIKERHEAFLKALGMPDFSSTILIDPQRIPSSEIKEVSWDDLEGAEPTITGANVLFTRDPSITLSVHPGDCPCAVLFAKDIDGNPILGMLHLGRRQTDAQLPKKAIMYLKSLEILQDSIMIGITPGISEKNYFISTDTPLPHAEKWERYITLSKKDGKDVYFLDIQGYIIQQFITCGVEPKHIEVYSVDTYEAAKKGQSFSHHYAMLTGLEERDGRFLVATSLK